MKMWSFDPALVVAILLGCIGVMSVGAVTAQAQQTQREPRFRVLVFSKTAGFRHTSIPDGIAAIWRLGEQNNFAVDASEDATLFDPDVLSRYKVVIFLSTTGDILTPGQQAAFEQFIKSGGATSVSTLRRTPSTTGRGSASWSGVTSRATPSNRTLW